MLCFCCSEQCIEAYELLLALAESEQSLILGQFRAAGVGSSPGKCPPSSLCATSHLVCMAAGIVSQEHEICLSSVFSIFPHD